MRSGLMQFFSMWWVISLLYAFPHKAGKEGLKKTYKTPHDGIKDDDEESAPPLVGGTELPSQLAADEKEYPKQVPGGSRKAESGEVEGKKKSECWAM